MTWEQYVRTKFTPKYTTSYSSANNSSTSYNRSYESWSERVDREETEGNNPTIWPGDEEESKVPWYRGPKKEWKVEQKKLFKNEKSTKLSTEGIRDRETFHCFEKGVTYYNHPQYYRQYFYSSKISYISFTLLNKEEIAQESIDNLIEGDVISLNRTTDYAIDKVADYGSVGVVYTLRNTMKHNDNHYLDAVELVNFIKNADAYTDDFGM